MRVASPAYQDLQIQACRPQIAQHKQGSRRTIVYPLDYAPETDIHQRWPDLVVARTYRKENGYNAHESRRVLFDALELFILILHAWTKVKVRELKDIMFVLEYFLLAYMILKLR